MLSASRPGWDIYLLFTSYGQALSHDGLSSKVEGRISMDQPNQNIGSSYSQRTNPIRYDNLVAAKLQHEVNGCIR